MALKQPIYEFALTSCQLHSPELLQRKFSFVYSTQSFLTPEFLHKIVLIMFKILQLADVSFDYKKVS